MLGHGNYTHRGTTRVAVFPRGASGASVGRRLQGDGAGTIDGGCEGDAVRRTRRGRPASDGERRQDENDFVHVRIGMTA